VAGYLAYLNDNRKAAALSEESRDLFESLGSDGKWGYAYAQINLAHIARNQGNPLQANALYEESLVLFQETGDQFAIAECIWEQGSTAYLYQPEQARRYLEKNLAIRREIGDQDGAASSLWLLGGLVARQHEYGKARQLWEESRRLFLEAKNTSAIAFVISDLGYLNWMEGNYAQAARDFDEILLTGRFGGDPLAISTGLEALGRLVLSQGDNDRAAKLLAEYLSFGRKKGSKLIIMNSLNNLGHLAWIQNDIPLAVKRYSEALEICRILGNPIAEAMILCGLGKTSLTGGNSESAREYFAKALEIIPVRYWYFGFSMEILLEGIAFLAIIQHQAQRAACLLGSTQAWHEQDFFKRFPKERLERENAIASLREKMGEEAFSAAWEA
jgi:tetratricopeptide (TPR) repeat protein